MSIETDLYAALTANAGVTAVVGTRIYPNVLPDDLDPNTPADWPAIAYSFISGVPIGSGSGSRCKDYRVQLDVYSPRYLNGVKAGRDALEAFALANNYRYQEVNDEWEKDSRLHHQIIEIFIAR